MTEEQFLEVTRWQDKTFPKANALSKIEHLKEEVIELAEAVCKKYSEENYTEMKMEFADCFLLLYGAANNVGMDYESICDAIHEKMKINKLRKWGEPDENGVVKHIK